MVHSIARESKLILVYDKCLFKGINFCKGENFSKKSRSLGEIHHLLPPGVHVMALLSTATATFGVFVMRVLSMQRAAVIAYSPDKRTVKYMYSVSIFCNSLGHI